MLNNLNILNSLGVVKCSSFVIPINKLASVVPINIEFSPSSY